MTRREFIELSAGAVAAAPWQTPPRAAAVDLPALTIARAAQLLAKRQLSPVELTRAVLARVEALNPRVGAFITVAADQALAAARSAEADLQRGRPRGPLHGIPVGVKDTYYTKGIRTTAATPVLEDFVPDADCTIVERLKAAGAILVGKTSLPEFSFGGFTPGCHNPWDLTRNAGGSSGGSAAAVAASMLLGAGGGDTSGSIRNPASYCGIVGLKPTFGLVSRYGVVPISWTLDHLGPMTKTVEDTAILLQAMAGHDGRDRYSANRPVPDYRQALTRRMKGLRVGVLAASEIDRFHPDVVRAFAAAVAVFRGLGAEIREVTFTPRMRAADAAQRVIRIAEAAAYHRQFLTSPARDKYLREGDRRASPGPSVRTSVEAGTLLTGAQYLQAQRYRTVFIEDMRAIYAPLDVLLSPTLPAAAGVPADPPETFRTWWNVCGFPAMSVPCGFSTTPAGLPLGLQISGKPFDEATLLAAGHAYQQATDWHRRQPPL